MEIDYSKINKHNLTVGDVIKNKPTGHPHLDMVGDIGWIYSKTTGKSIARYVVVKTHKDKKTNEALAVDIQISASFNSHECTPNPEAVCRLHQSRFPCPVCRKLEYENY